MSDIRGSDPASTPTVELRVYRDGVLFRRELCDSEEDAVDACERWSELPGVHCEIDDLSGEEHVTEGFEPERQPMEDLGDERRAAGEPFPERLAE